MPIQYIIIIKYLYCFCLILLISCVCFFSETVLPFGYMQICYFYYSIAPADFVKQRIKIEATVWLSQQFVPVISAEQLQTKEKHHNYHSHSCGQILATHVRGNIRSPACSATSPVNPNYNSSDWVNLKYLSVRLNFLTHVHSSNAWYFNFKQIYNLLQNFSKSSFDNQPNSTSRRTPIWNFQFKSRSYKIIAIFEK